MFDWWNNTFLPWAGKNLEGAAKIENTTFKPWVEDSHKPPNHSVSLPDRPVLTRQLRGRPLTAKRYLEFEITVFSGDPIKCAHASVTVTALQILVEENGIPSVSELFVPDPYPLN
jgi:hypothetical protein